MKIVKLLEEILIDINKEDVIPALQGYREHLSEWLLNEPENAEEEGAPEIMKAIDIVIDGIESVENV